MEALGLIGGIIAVAQAGDRVIELLKKVRPLFDAPKNVDVLIDEISTFKSILADLQNVLNHTATLPIQIGHANINGNIEQAQNVLGELEYLVEHSFVKSEVRPADGSRKINRIAWTKKLHEVEHLRRRLRDIKLNILVQLGGIQS